MTKLGKNHECACKAQTIMETSRAASETQLRELPEPRVLPHAV
jgi:hypothetical protein